MLPCWFGGADRCKLLVGIKFKVIEECLSLKTWRIDALLRLRVTFGCDKV